MTDSLMVEAIERASTVLKAPSQIEIATLVLVAATTVLWGIYVYYTRKTFVEIKLQTQLQSQGYLVMDLATQSGNSEEFRKTDLPVGTTEAKQLHERWESLLKKEIPKALRGSEFAILTLKNRGKSDVIWAKVSVHAHVDPGTYLRRERFATEVKESWELEITEAIRPDEEFSVPIMQVNAFPYLKLTWSVQYRDIHNNEMDAKAGRRDLVTRNPLTDPPASDLGSSRTSENEDGSS